MFAGRLDLLFHFPSAKKRCHSDPSAVGNAAFVLYLCARSMYRGLILKKKRAYTWYTFKVTLSCLIQVIVSQHSRKFTFLCETFRRQAGSQETAGVKNCGDFFLRIGTKAFLLLSFEHFNLSQIFKAWSTNSHTNSSIKHPQTPSLHFLEAFSWMNWT